MLKTLNECMQARYHVRQLKCEYEREIEWRERIDDTPETIAELKTLRHYIESLTGQISKMDALIGEMIKIPVGTYDYAVKIGGLADKDPSIWTATVKA